MPEEDGGDAEGANTALVEAQPLGLGLAPADFNRLVDHGRRIKHAVMQAMKITHPFEPDLSFLHGSDDDEAPDLFGSDDDDDLGLGGDDFDVPSFLK